MRLLPPAAPSLPLARSLDSIHQCSAEVPAFPVQSGQAIRDEVGHEDTVRVEEAILLRIPNLICGSHLAFFQPLFALDHLRSGIHENGEHSPATLLIGARVLVRETGVGSDVGARSEEPDLTVSGAKAFLQYERHDLLGRAVEGKLD